MTSIAQVCLLGLGEVGTVLAQDLLKGTELSLRIWDRQFADSGLRASQNLASLPETEPETERIVAAQDAASAAIDCQLVISAVTADQDLVAAQSILAGLPGDCWFLDLNSVSPGTKQKVSELVQNAGGRYVEAAVMSPIEPKRIASTILTGGPNSQSFEALGKALGFTGLQHYSVTLGKAAATKMCRSVVVKGMEALLTESLLSAKYYGVEESVLDSLNNLFPHADWPAHAHYMISRSLQHGVRRAEEMREVVKTVADADLQPWMSQACVERQSWAPQFAAALSQQQLSPMLAAVREQMNQSTITQK